MRQTSEKEEEEEVFQRTDESVIGSRDDLLTMLVTIA